ncbi:MAG: EAL domain-containing protein [Solirubrobacteraceae bacterium]
MPGPGAAGRRNPAVPDHGTGLTARALFHAAPDALVVVDPDGLICEANEQATALFGYLPDELIGEPLDLLVPDARRWDHRRRMIEYAEAPTLRPMGREREVAARRRDGTELPVSVTLSPLHTPQGLFVIAAVRDATERSLERGRLKGAEELLRTTIDHAPIGMGLVSTDGRWLRVNRALCEMTGYSEHELLARTVADICHPDDRHIDERNIDRIVAGEIKSYENEKRFIRADGSIRWVQLSASLVRDAAGAPKHFVSQIQDITDRKDYELELRHLATHDPLTGLANRRTLEQEIERQLESQARYGDELALLMVDLDHFKYINDTLGHRVGDQVICEAARAMSARLRNGDMVARLGGDEFAILLARCDADAARAVAGKILASLADLRVQGPDHELRLSASVGVVAARPEDAYDRDTLLAASDLTMYEAKQSGRNRFAVHDPRGHSRLLAKDRLAWSNRIRRALRDDLFVLHYQPIVDVAGGSAHRYEALVRMADGPGEPVAPEAFLEIAQRYGMMCAIDRWVIAQVLADLSSGRLPEGATIAVNVSPASLADADLLELIDRLLAEHEVQPSQLIFEITQSAAISRLDEAQRFGRRLQSMGCRVALDRFGTGYGSLLHLKHLPYDYIKIDGEFVRGMTRNEHDRVLVEALVGIARGMSKQTIAGFVGDDETMDSLRGLGVDLAQGFHLGRPAPAGRFSAPPER